MRFFKATGLMAMLAALALSACGTQQPAPVTYRGGQPAAPVAAAPAPQVQTQTVSPTTPLALPEQRSTPAGGGVVDYGGYKAVVAQQGDTLEAMARRAGLSATELANYNGIPSGWSPRPGDELILPPGAGGSAALTTPAATQVAAASPASTYRLPSAPAPTQAAAPSRLDLDGIERSLGQRASTVTPAQPQPAAAAPASGARAQAPTPRPVSVPQRRVAAAPPAPARPAPQQAAPRPKPAAPARTAAAPARFSAPVDGRITRGFHQGGSRNDGVDFAAPSGAPVKAAAEGEVALISESLGGLGTIVLIRHGGDLLTVYGRVDGVSVKQGDRVSRGQRIGKVAAAPAGRDPSLHFEVRRGAEAVDPANYL